MTEKQKWFEEKLMKEIEVELNDNDIAWEQYTVYAENGFDSYRTSVSSASSDIEMLLSAKKIGLQAAMENRDAKLYGKK